MIKTHLPILCSLVKISNLQKDQFISLILRKDSKKSDKEEEKEPFPQENDIYFSFMCPLIHFN